MYELPDRMDPKVFEGMSLDQVFLSPFSMQLAFSNDVIVQAESAISIGSVASLDVETVLFSEGIRVPDALCRVIGDRVSRATIRDRHDLVFAFSRDLELVVHGDDPHYECYTVYGLGDQIIV